ncbi:MAG: alanine--tRNA ligase [Succinatimonas sp.]|nr:alanine--tRNA ligase [Succinatimonas sp.]MDD5868357.1 alanine--tRNA ligase [Succinatimonas sp.]
MYMTTEQIRTAYLKFFEENGHTIVRSSSLVPYNDPTLLFTNAGMNQFKDIYLGKEKRSYVRATTAQKCVRAGGKQNDLDNVGYTARHHTFFEMLGNFSFGDYFKKEAIAFAWKLLTEVYKLPKESLMVTVYEKDDEAYDIWNKQIGLPPEKIVRIGDNKGGLYESDNFWQMGDTGPCGPCSEIFYDHGEDVQGGPPGSPDEDGDRFIEIWNIVFMQYNRKIDGTFEKLAKPMIDNGLGLERIAAVLQGVHSNYEIDLFVELEKAAAAVLGVTDLQSKSLRVIADHIRSCSFLIADGVLPSNEGRGYVLRRIIRRAVRHGRLLGAKDVFFYKLVDKLAQLMGNAYPELVEQKALIERTLKKEEEQFLKTLDRGLALLEQELVKLGDSKTFPGDVAFKLYDTYGFPADLTQDVVRDRGYVVDQEGFDKCMAEQKARAKSASTFGIDYNKELKITENTEFLGYNSLSADAKITHIFKDGVEVDSIATDEQAVIVLDKTPFYGEMGGQVGDKGVITIGENARFIVEDTKHAAKATIHVGRVDIGEFDKGATVVATVDKSIRAEIAKHHSATHLLDAALRQVVGDSVAQKGSYVDNNRLRFDYSHSQPLTLAERRAVTDLVNQKIQENLKVETNVMDLDEAKKSGAIALFDEKYEDKVRVVSMGDFSKELCGGTHTVDTGDLGAFVLLSDESIASGVRRIEALVGHAAVEYLDDLYNEVGQAKALLKVGGNATLATKAEAVLDHAKSLEKENEQLKEKIVALESAALVAKAHEVKGVTVVSAKIANYDAKALRVAVDNLKCRFESSVIVLGSVSEDNKVSLIAAVSKDLVSKVKAGDLVREIASYVGGKGGGRPDMAQAGGTNPEGLDKAIAAVDSLVSERV